MLLPLFFAYLISLSISSSQLYFTMPYTQHTTSTIQHTIQIEVNRYPYLIDIAIDNSSEYILNLQQISKIKQAIDRPDYRKNQQNIFGIVQFIGTQRSDQRLQAKRRIGYDIYYFGRDLFPRLTWFNLKHIKQVSLSDRQSKVSEGRLSFGAKSITNPIFRDLKRYSGYMKSPVLTFKKISNDQGKIFFGGYPLNQLQNAIASSTVKFDTNNDNNIKILTQSLIVKRKNDKTVDQFYLFKEMIRFKIVLSQRTIILPKICKDTIQRTLAGCQFHDDSSIDSQIQFITYLSCNNPTFSKISSLSFQITITGSKIPLIFYFQDLVKTKTNSRVVFDIAVGNDQLLQIGESLLDRYMIGFNYQDNTFTYGVKGNQPWLDRFVVYRVVSYVLAVTFIISLIVVVLSRNTRKQVIETVKKDVMSFKPSKSSGYQMAEVSQNSYQYIGQ